jgi:hypothetical protein
LSASGGKWLAALPRPTPIARVDASGPQSIRTLRVPSRPRTSTSRPLASVMSVGHAIRRVQRKLALRDFVPQNNHCVHPSELQGLPARRVQRREFRRLLQVICPRHLPANVQTVPCIAY